MRLDKLLQLLLPSPTLIYKLLIINNMHGDGIEPPIDSQS